MEKYINPTRIIKAEKSVCEENLLAKKHNQMPGKFVTVSVMAGHRVPLRFYQKRLQELKF